MSAGGPRVPQSEERSVAKDPAVLLVCEHGEPLEDVALRWARRGTVTPLRLPFWHDSTLSRTMRLHALTEEERAAVEAEAGALMEALRKALMAQGVADAQWQYLRQGLETYAVTPLVESAGLIEAAARRLGATTIVTVTDLRSRRWWSGQSMTGAAAAEAAERVGARHVAEWRPGIGRLVKGLLYTMRALALVVRRESARKRAGASRKPKRAEVLILAAGPVVEGLALRLADKVRAAGATAELARDPLADPSEQAGEFVVLGDMASLQGEEARAEAKGAVLGRRAWARAVAGEMKGAVPDRYVAALETRLAYVGMAERLWLMRLGADAEALLDAVRPRVVVGFHFLPRLATPLVVAARRRGIRTVCCQHGLIPALDYRSPWYDEYLVFNEYTAKVIRPMVGEAARIRVVGSPALDGLAGWAPESTGARGEKPVVLIATQPNDPAGSEAKDDWWFAVMARACAAAGAEAQVKLHPQQSAEREGEMYRRALEKAGCSGTIVAHGTADLRDLIATCDVFVSQFSTTILDALAIGKPVVFVELREGPPFYPFDDFGAAIRVTRAEEAEEALRRAMSEEGRAEMQAARAAFAVRHLEPMDGKAMERMAEAILAD
jgi:UDP-N-acetylglucosamine:LPS N-acetylglucosamine transferase